MKLLLKKSSIILPIISLLLLCFNYDICEYYYSDNIKKWWHLKVDIYCLIISLLFIFASINFKNSKLHKLILDICVGLSLVNVVDRFFYNIREFTNSDIAMITYTFVFAFYNYFKNGDE